MRYSALRSLYDSVVRRRALARDEVPPFPPRTLTSRGSLDVDSSSAQQRRHALQGVLNGLFGARPDLLADDEVTRRDEGRRGETRRDEETTQQR